MKRCQVLFVLIVTLLAAHGLAGAAEKPMRIRAGLKVEDLGSPVRTRTISNVYVFKLPTTGELHLTMYLQAFSGMQNDPPFQIYDLNLATGKARIVAGMVGRPGPQATIVAGNGKLYMGTSRPCDVLEYDFATGKARRLGRLDENYYHGIQIIAEGADGAVYTGNLGFHAGRIDPETGKIEDLGVMGDGGWGSYGYVYSLAADRRYVYCGMGQQPWYLVIYDRQTRTQKSYFEAKKGEPNVTSSVIGAADGNIYYEQGRDTYLLKDGEPAKLDKRPKIERMRRGRVVEIGDVQKEYGLEVDIDDVRPTNWNNGEVVVRWRPFDAAQGGGAKEWKTSATQGADVYPDVPKRLAPLPDGKIIGFSAFYGPFFTFDPETKTSADLGPSPGSIYDILVVGDKAYLSGYSSLFCVYDRTKPWTISAKNGFYSKDQNPYRVPIQPTGKYNYFLTLGADGRVYSGQHHERSSVGGSFAWFDPATGKTGGFRKEFERYDVRDIQAVNDGRTIVVSTVALDKDKNGQIFVYDTESRKIVATYEPLPGVRETGKLLDAGSDQVLALVRISEKQADGAAKEKGILYKLDLKTGKVLFEKIIPRRVFNGQLDVDMLMADARFAPGPDGCGWLFIDDQLCRIHPDDGSIDEIMKMDKRGRMFFIGNDLYVYNGGREYFGGFSQILRIRDVFDKAAN